MTDFIVNEIKQRIKMPELLDNYGFDVRRGRIPCPFHNGKDRNCGVKDDYIYCFVCGESADQIGFVQKYFDVSFPEALAKLNDDFCLGLPIGEKLDKRKRQEIARRSFELRKEREKKKKEEEAVRSAYYAALDEWVRLDRQKREYEPKSETDILHPLFVEAIKKLESASYRLDCAEMEFSKCNNKSL